MHTCMHACKYIHAHIHTYIHIVLTRQGLAEAERPCVLLLPPLPPLRGKHARVLPLFFKGGGSARGVAAYPAVYLEYALAYGQHMCLRMGLPGLRLCGWRALTYVFFFFERNYLRWCEGH